MDLFYRILVHEDKVCYMYVWKLDAIITISGLIFISKCRPLRTFAHSLDPDQARQNIGPDLDPNCLTL